MAAIPLDGEWRLHLVEYDSELPPLEVYGLDVDFSFEPECRQTGFEYHCPQHLRSKLIDNGVPFSVPGHVQEALMNVRMLQDPLKAEHERFARWVPFHHWKILKRFQISRQYLMEDHLHMVFNSVDCVSIIHINGQYVGTTDNRFQKYRFPVKHLLREGENDIELTLFGSAYIAQALASLLPYPIPFGEFKNGERNGNLLRTVQCHFGWDWGPCIIPLGIPESVSLECFSHARLDEIALCYDIVRGGKDSSEFGAEMYVRVLFDPTENPVVQGRLSLEVVDIAHSGSSERIVAKRSDLIGFEDDNSGTNNNGDDDRIQFAGFQASSTLQLPTIELWWPIGVGDAKLYELRVGYSPVSEDGEEISGLRQEMKRSIGFREIEVFDEKGKFGFAVNGVPFFAKGSNFIPPHPFSTSVRPRALESLLRSAVAAHHNVLRVWGGGYYLPREFYDLCDRLGICVWQDFMFSCAMYPGAVDGFLSSVEVEVRQQILRLGSHASVVLWCGNNEVEQALGCWYPEVKSHPQRYTADYVKLFVDRIGRLCRSEDLQRRTYWPSSPSNGLDRWQTANAMEFGDSHIWTVWHEGEPIQSYASLQPLFASEFGFQSYPDVPSIVRDVFERRIEETAAVESQLNLCHPRLLYRQRSPGGEKPNAVILTELMRLFRLPMGSFAAVQMLSQLIQAEAMRISLESFRLQFPHCRGALYWQLNDIWTAPSWSTLQSDGSWKAAHHAVRRAFCGVRTVARTVSETGKPLILDRETVSDAWIDVKVINDFSYAVDVLITLTLSPDALLMRNGRQWEKQNRRRAHIVVSAAPNGAVTQALHCRVLSASLPTMSPTTPRRKTRVSAEAGRFENGVDGGSGSRSDGGTGRLFAPAAGDSVAELFVSEYGIGVFESPVVARWSPQRLEWMLPECGDGDSLDALALTNAAMTVASEVLAASSTSKRNTATQRSDGYFLSRDLILMARPRDLELHRDSTLHISDVLIVLDPPVNVPTGTMYTALDPLISFDLMLQAAAPVLFAEFIANDVNLWFGALLREPAVQLMSPLDLIQIPTEVSLQLIFSDAGFHVLEHETTIQVHVCIRDAQSAAAEVHLRRIVAQRTKDVEWRKMAEATLRRNVACRSLADSML